jgi:hypothetical protein
MGHGHRDRAQARMQRAIYNNLFSGIKGVIVGAAEACAETVFLVRVGTGPRRLDDVGLINSVNFIKI